MSDKEEPSEEQVESKAEESENTGPEAPAVAETPANKLSRPPVVDIESILTPISGDEPSGKYLRYEEIYDELSEARRADDILAQGEWETELKVADFRKVIELAVPVLSTETKDLQIAAWLTEALVAEHGFAGMRDSLKIIVGLLKGFWGSLYPEAEDGDEEGRANALAWIDEKTGALLRNAPITVDGWGYNGYLDSKKFDIPDNVEGLSSDQQLKFSALREQAERENRATAVKWKQAVTKTKRAFCEEVDVAIAECRAEYKNLNAAIEEVFDRNQAPSLPEINRALSDIGTRAGKILAQKRIEEPDPSDASAESEGPDAGAAQSGKAAGTSGAIQSRADALRRLTEIAAFFKATEPHSPVSYLVNRAVSWGSMPLETWLQDVIKDQNILNQLKQTLGFNTNTGSENTSETQSDQASPPVQPLQ